MPIQSTLSAASNTAHLFQTIVNAVENNAPNEGENTIVNVKNYNLNSLVPKKPFFSYSASVPYAPCLEGADYIVFTSFLDMDRETMSTLRSIVEDSQTQVKSGPSLFYNKQGPNASLEDEIYIDCQPVGSSEETTMVTGGSGSSGSSGGSWEPKDALKNPWFQLILIGLGFLLILFGIRFLISYFKQEIQSLESFVISGGGGIRNKRK